MPLATHINEDVLEAYSLGRIAEAEAAGLEEHLLICHSCQERLEQADDFVRAFRMAVRSLPPPKVAPALRPMSSWRWFLSGGWRPVPLAAGLAMAVLAVVTLAPRSGELAGETGVRLAAMRGSGPDAIAAVPAHRRLRLELDTKALAGAAYRIELADARGRQLWESPAPVAVEHESVRSSVPRAVPAGLYWVRLYDPVSGQLAREYGLRAR